MSDAIWTGWDRHRRERWDLRFMDLARLVGSWSKDPSTRVGACIVRPDRTVASVAFNGFARGLPDEPALYEHRDFKIATVLHAEQNALMFARERLDGYTLYVSGLPPCAHCASQIIQAGIRRVVCESGPVPERWAENMAWAEENLRRAEVRLVRLPACDAVEHEVV